MLGRWSELLHRAGGKDQGCQWWCSRKSPAEDALPRVLSQRSQALHLTNLHTSSVLQGVDPDHKKTHDKKRGGQGDKSRQKPPCWTRIQEFKDGLMDSSTEIDRGFSPNPSDPEMSAATLSYVS